MLAAKTNEEAEQRGNPAAQEQKKNIALTCQSKGPTKKYFAKMDRATATTIFLASEVPGEAVYVDIAIDLGL